MLGIIGAMEIEIQGIAKLLDEAVESQSGEFRFTKGKLHGKDVVVCKCGIGKVNSSSAAALMWEKFRVDEIINIGVAGGYRTLKQCDTVISSYTCEHDFDLTPDGLKKGQLSADLPALIKCDEALVKKLEDIAKFKGYPVSVGVIASGDQFIASNAVSQHITDEFGAIAYDMESGAINHVCRMLGVKFAALRSISDNGTDDAVESFYTFLTRAAAVCVDVISEYVKNA